MFANVLFVTKRKAVKNSFHIFVVKVWKSNTIPRNSIQPGGIFPESSGKSLQKQRKFPGKLLAIMQGGKASLDILVTLQCFFT
jgi:hypothetical protein